MKQFFHGRNLPRHNQASGRGVAHQAPDPADTQPKLASWYNGAVGPRSSSDLAAGHITFSRPTGPTGPVVDADSDKMTEHEHRERDKKFNKGSLRSRRFMGPGNL